MSTMKDYKEFMLEQQKVLTESEKWAKSEAMKVLDDHLKKMEHKMEVSEAESFQNFITKMKKSK